MNSSDSNNLNILDLPNEILLIIFNKLHTVDTLYSLVDVNERFDQLVLDSLHIRNLDTASMIIRSNIDRTISTDNRVLSRICEKILPRIHHKLSELTVEQDSMHRILFTVNYPQLYSLSLVNFQEDMLIRCLTGILMNFVHLNLQNKKL